MSIYNSTAKQVIIDNYLDQLKFEMFGPVPESEMSGLTPGSFSDISPLDDFLKVFPESKEFKQSLGNFSGIAMMFKTSEDISKSFEGVLKLVESISDLSNGSGCSFLDGRVCRTEDFSKYLKTSSLGIEISNAKKHDFKPGKLPRVIKSLTNVMKKAIYKNSKEDLLSDLTKQQMKLTTSGEVFLNQRLEETAEKAKKSFALYFNQGQMSINEIQYLLLQKKISLFHIEFVPGHVESIHQKKNIDEVFRLMSNSRLKLNLKTTKKIVKNVMFHQKKHICAAGKLRATRRVGRIGNVLKEGIEQYKEQHRQFVTIYKIAKSKGIKPDQVTELQIKQYKKEEADKSFEALCVEESGIKRKALKKKKRASAKASKATSSQISPLKQETISFSTSAIKSEAKACVVAYKKPKSEVMGIHTRVSSWFSVGDNLEVIKSFRDIRYQCMTDDRLTQQRDDHALNGMQYVFFNVFDRERYGMYVGFFEGHPSWNFHAKKTIYRKGEEEISSGIISIGLGENTTDGGSKKIIVHMKFDEIRGQINSGKDLAKFIEPSGAQTQEEDSGWTTVVDQTSAYKKVGDNIVLDYPERRVKFEIEPLV